MTTPREIISLLEKAIGSKFKIIKTQSGLELKALREKSDGGEAGATFPILALEFMRDMNVGYDLEREQKV